MSIYSHSSASHLAGSKRSRLELKTKEKEVGTMAPIQMERYSAKVEEKEEMTKQKRK